MSRIKTYVNNKSTHLKVKYLLNTKLSSVIYKLPCQIYANNIQIKRICLITILLIRIHEIINPTFVVRNEERISKQQVTSIVCQNATFISQGTSRDCQMFFSWKQKSKHGAIDWRICVRTLYKTNYSNCVLWTYFPILLRWHGIVLPTNIQRWGEFVLSVSIPQWYRF